MNRSIVFLLLCFWFSFTCSEQGHETRNGGPHTKIPLKPLKRLKCVRSAYSRHNYYYDSMGRLERTVVTDGRDSTTSKLTEIYEYNAQGKIISSRSELFTQQYVYDPNGRLLKHLRTDHQGRKDSVTFAHHKDGSVTGTWNTVKYYYENRCLTRIYMGDKLSFRGRERGVTVNYTHNSKPDLAYAGILNFLDPLTLADFSNGTAQIFGPSELTLYEQCGFNYSFIPLRFERTYDNEGYPVKLRTLTVTGVVSGPEITYSYYK